jgi:putative peptidoglycan lipid II flippase
MTGLSRIAGLVRDIVFAQFLGSGLLADAFFVAFRIPNFFRRIFAEGAFSVAFVPVYSGYEAQVGGACTGEFLDFMSGRLGLILLSLTALGTIGAPVLVTMIAPGFLDHPEKFEATTKALRLTFPYLFFISFVAMAGGILNTRERFAVPAITPLFLNVCLIGAVFLLVPRMENAAVALGLGVLIAGIVQLAFQLPFLRLERRLPTPRVNPRSSADEEGLEGVRKVFRLMLPAFFGTSVAQVNLLVNTVVASFLVTGSVSWLYYSDRLMEFPLGIFGIALATVILPKLSSQYVSESLDAFSQTLEWALRLVFVICIPASVALAVLSEPLMIVLFQRGEFSPQDAEMAGRSLVAFAAGLLAFVSVKVLAPGFFARQDTKTPVKAGVFSVIVNIVFCLVLFKPLDHVGLAVATSIAGFVNAGLLCRWLYVEKIYQPAKGWTLYALKVVLSAAIMGLILWFGSGDSEKWLEARTLSRVGMLIQWVTIGGVSYFCSLYAFGIRFHQFIPRSDDESKE